jgi:Lon protease-like protein
MSENQESKNLRLFPLQSVVLFPGMELPLVAFEPRYLQLVSECVEANEPFGVLLLREGFEVGDNDLSPFEIGTTAHLLNTENTPDGRIRLTAIGGYRFKVISFHYDMPYLSAAVEYIEDSSHEMIDPSLTENVMHDAGSFVKQFIASQGGYIREVPFPEDPVILSYQVAQLFSGNPVKQQRLLETSTFDRLWEELDLLKEAREQLKTKRKHNPKSSFSNN